MAHGLGMIVKTEISMQKPWPILKEKVKSKYLNLNKDKNIINGTINDSIINSDETSKSDVDTCDITTVIKS